jgi:crotonobetainyl-CoA:carnitine CoA-transferase CaiB-like acyl-CoA transferase
VVDGQLAPLQGLKVVEISVAMAGPYCGMMLADYGADVTKIERVGEGDESRKWAPFFGGKLSHYFAAVNRNKKSLAVDIKDKSGAEIVRRLAADADVLIDNFRPGALEGAGLGYEALSELNPRLIYCSITGYGATGPLKSERANDVAMQAYAGGMSITGEAGRGPVKMGISVADIGAGMFATTGILMALQMRNTTGRGQRVDTSLLEGQIAMLSYHFAAYFASGKVPERKGSSAQGLVPYQAFEAKDGWMVVAVFTDRMWSELCRAIGIPEWGEDPRFNSPQQRMSHREEIVGALTEIFAREPVAAWQKRLRPAGVPCNPVLAIDQVARDEQVRARDMIVEIDDPEIGKLQMAGVPIKFSDAGGGVRMAPPQLGQHTRKILETLGYSADDVERLIAQGIVGAL